MNSEPLLKSAYLKVERAKQQVTELESKISLFFEKRPYTIYRECDSKNGDELIVYYPTEAIPLEWSVLIGEILFNLRSSLDLAVYELTIKEIGNPLPKTEFPIFNDRASFFQTKKNGDAASGSGLFKIRGLNQKTQDCIEQLQTYHVHVLGGITYVKILHDLNIVDKHKELHICRYTNRQIEIINLNQIPLPGLAIRTGFGINLDERVELVRWRFTAYEHKRMSVGVNIFPEISFNENNLEIFTKPQPVLELLNQLIHAVDDILKRLMDTVD